MADVFSPEKRSAVMSSIKSKDTKLEKIVFSYLRKNKVYFQKHYSKVPGKPDVALPRKKRAIFINSSFWHGRDYDNLKLQLNEYWHRRITANMKRDKLVNQKLTDCGWELLIVWDKELTPLKTREEALNRIKHFLTK